MKKNEETKLESIKAELQKLSGKLSDAKDGASEMISENPMRATLAAFGVGVVAGAILIKLLERK